MIDEEIASLLEEAGYRFNSVTGRYDVTSGSTPDEEADGHSREFVADELGIPLDDLERWEVEVGGATPPDSVLDSAFSADTQPTFDLPEDAPPGADA